MKVFSLTPKFTLAGLLTLVVTLTAVPVFAAGTLNVYNCCQPQRFSHRSLDPSRQHLATS